MNLQEIFETDRRGLPTSSFVEQLTDTTAIFSYYGQGFSHEGIFSYDENIGWKFVRCYYREIEHISSEEKIKLMQKTVDSLKGIGLTEITDNGNYITFSRKKNEQETDQKKD